MASAHDAADDVGPRHRAPQQHPDEGEPGENPESNGQFTAVARNAAGEADVFTEPHEHADRVPEDEQQRHAPRIDEERPHGPFSGRAYRTGAATLGLLSRVVLSGIALFGVFVRHLSPPSTLTM